MVWKKRVPRSSRKPAQHCAQKQARTKDAPGIPGSITHGDRNELQHQQQRHQTPHHVPVQRVADVFIAHAQRLRHDPAHQSHQQTASNRLKRQRPSRRSEKPFAKSQQQSRKRGRNQTASHSKRRVQSKLRRMNQLILRHLKQRMIAEQQLQNCPGSRGSQHHRTQHRRMQVADYFFQRKQNRGQWSIKRRSDGCRSPYWDQRLHSLRTQPEFPSKHRRNTRTYLNRRAFSSQRYSAGQRRRRAEKLSKNRFDRNAAFARVQRRLRLRRSASSRIRKKSEQQVSHSQRANRWD